MQFSKSAVLFADADHAVVIALVIYIVYYKVMEGGLRPSSVGPKGPAEGLKLPSFSISFASPTTALVYFSKAGTPKKINWKMARARIVAILVRRRSLGTV